MANEKKTNILGTAGAIVGGLSTIGGWLGIGEKRQDRRQLEQQGKLNEINAKTAKEMADYEQDLKLKMWKDTNYTEQLKQADMAGVSKAAVLGGSGTGTQGASVGSVGGGSAADAAATQNAKTQMMGQGMQLASQLALMKAQKENIEADTANKVAGTENTGVVTETGKVDLATKKGTQQAEIQKAKTEADTAIEEMWLKHNDRTVSDATIKQRVESATQELIGQIAKNKNTDADTKKKQAEAIIAQFDAKMTEEGISTKAPWYLKMVMDTLTKFGINPVGSAKEAIK